MLIAEADVRARWIVATLDAALSELQVNGRSAELSARILALIGEARGNAAGLADALAPGAAAVSTAPSHPMPHARDVASNVLPFRAQA